MREQPNRTEMIELPAVPREGDVICWDFDTPPFMVKSVIFIANLDYVEVRGW